MDKVNLRSFNTQKIVAHGGNGFVDWSRIVGPTPGSYINFIDRAIVPPNSSIGRHLHEGTEEIYLILSGVAEMTLGASRFTVEPFDMVINRGDYHSLSNSSDSDVEIFVIEIRQAHEIPES